MNNTIEQVSARSIRETKYPQGTSTVTGLKIEEDLYGSIVDTGVIPSSYSQHFNFWGVANKVAIGIIGSASLWGHHASTGGPPVVSDADFSSKLWQQISNWPGSELFGTKAPDQDVKHSSSATAKLRVDRLSKIQASFGIPMTDLAAILAITRQSLYKWLDSEREIVLQEASRERLVSIERLAAAWSNSNSAPLSLAAKEPLASGQSILNLLAQPVLNEDAIKEAFAELLGRLAAMPKSLSQRMTEAGYKRRPSAFALPSDE